MVDRLFAVSSFHKRPCVNLTQHQLGLFFQNPFCSTHHAALRTNKLALFFQIMLVIRASDYQAVIIRVSGYQFKSSWFPAVLLPFILIPAVVVFTILHFNSLRTTNRQLCTNIFVNYYTNCNVICPGNSRKNLRDLYRLELMNDSIRWIIKKAIRAVISPQWA